MIPIIIFFAAAAAFADVSLQDTDGTVHLNPDDSKNITVPDGHYVELNITFRKTYGFGPACYYGVHFKIRDGLNQSAHLLGSFCEFQVTI